MTPENKKQPIENVKPQQNDFWFFPKKCRKMNQDTNEKLVNDDLAYIRNRNTANAHSDASQKLIDVRTQIAKKNDSQSNWQIFVKMIVIGSGAFMFVNAASVLTAKLGKFSFPASIIVGGIASVALDHCATKAITNKGIKDNTKTVVETLKEEKKLHFQDNHPLTNEYFDEQQRFVFKIEGDKLGYKHEIPFNAGIAVFLNVLEFTSAFILLSSVNMLSGGIPLVARPILSSLTILFTWGFALYQRENFELPEHYADLMPIYHKYVFSNPSNEVLINQEYQDVLMDAGINYVIDPANPYPNKKVARNQANKDYCNYVIGQLEKSHKNQISIIEKELKQDLNDVASPYKPIRGLNDKEQNERKKQWIAEEKERLNENAQNDLKSIESAFNAEINVWQRRINEIDIDYKKANSIIKVETSNEI